jgi:hypothetical protein
MGLDQDHSQVFFFGSGGARRRILLQGSSLFCEVLLKKNDTITKSARNDKEPG